MLQKQPLQLFLHADQNSDKETEVVPADVDVEEVQRLFLCYKWMVLCPVYNRQCRGGSIESGWDNSSIIITRSIDHVAGWRAPVWKSSDNRTYVCMKACSNEISSYINRMARNREAGKDREKEGQREGTEGEGREEGEGKTEKVAQTRRRYRKGELGDTWGEEGRGEIYKGEGGGEKEGGEREREREGEREGGR